MGPVRLLSIQSLLAIEREKYGSLGINDSEDKLLSGGLEVEIWFVYSIQPKNDPTLISPTSSVQQHGKMCAVTISDVPQTGMADGVPSSNVLWQAESQFLNQVGEFHPEHNVISWEARYPGRDGPVLSTFRVLIPSHED